MSLWPSRTQWRNWSLPNKLSAIGTLAGLVSLLVSLLLFAYDKVIQQMHRVPVRVLEFALTTTGVDAPGRNEKPLTLSDISSRRLHILTVRNPNRIPVVNLQLRTQFPEAILSVKSADTSASYTVLSAEDWDKQPLVIEGDVTSSNSVEPYASGESTGLWHVTVNSVPAESIVRIGLTTTNGAQGGLYSEEIKKFYGTQGREFVWLVQGDYQYSTDSGVVREQFLVPVKYNAEDRTTKTLPFVRGTKSTTIRQGQGVRIPGILRTRGYLLFKGPKGTEFISPFMLERVDDILVRQGLFGSPPINPGFYIQWKRGNN